MGTLPKLYAIADRATLDARGVRVADFANGLYKSGVTLLQYRDKGGGPQEILRAAAEVSAVFADVDATLILNDRADLAVLAGWGVHVGQGDLAVEDARRVMAASPADSSAPPRIDKSEDKRRWIGVSTHTGAQVRAADESEADYVAVGPVFRTATKLDAEPVVGLEGVRRARALTTKPLVAIGGITLANARSVLDAGADAVAVISGLFVPGRTVADVARDFLKLLR